MIVTKLLKDQQQEENDELTREEEGEDWNDAIDPTNYIVKPEDQAIAKMPPKRKSHLRTKTTLGDLASLTNEATKQATDYTNFTPRESIEEVAKKYLGQDAVEEERDPNTPYVITIEEYTSEHDDFDKIVLTYYQDDDTVTSEDEEMMPDYERYIGGEALLRFGEKTDDPDSVYIRNEKEGVDYEVVRLHKSYSETVLGIIPVREKRRKVRKVDANDKAEDQD